MFTSVLRAFSCSKALLASATLTVGLSGVLTSQATAREVGGVNLPDTATVQGQPLMLNGVGAGGWCR